MSAAISGAGAYVIPDVAALIRATISAPFAKMKKADRRPAVLQNCTRSWEPGRSWALHPGQNSLLLRLLGLLRLGLLRLLRFLSHSILSRFHGLNATPRHAWRRASLATSSMTIPPDSEAAAACRHGVVITLSTVVVHFDVIFCRNAPRHRRSHRAHHA